MSTPTGAGYGFVGSTFGETDLVSPYLKMYDIPKSEVQAIKPPDPFSATAEGEGWNNVVIGATNYYGELPQNTDPQLMSMLTSEKLDPSQVRVAAQLRQSNAQAQKNISRLAEISNASTKTFNSFSAKVREDSGKYGNYYNRKKLQDYQKFEKMLGALPSAASGYDLTNRDGLRFSVTLDGLLTAAKQAGVEESELERLAQDGSIVVSEDGTVLVNPTSDSFRLNEGDFIQSDKWTNIIDSQARPTQSISEGGMTEDGAYYDKESSKRLIADQYAKTLLPHIFSAKDFSRISVNKDGTIDVKSREVELETPALNYAQEADFEIIGDNRVSAEDAKSIFSQMFEYGANQEGFTRHTSSTPRGRSGGFGNVSKTYSPASMIDETDNTKPLQSIPSGYTVVTYNQGSQKYEKQVANPGVSYSVSVKVPVDVSLPEAGGKINLNNFIIGDDREIYVRGNVKPENVDMFDPQSLLTQYRAKGLLGSRSESTTEFIKLAGNLSTMISEVDSQMKLSEAYPDITNPKERMIRFIMDGDTLRSEQLAGGRSAAQGALSGF